MTESSQREYLDDIPAEIQDLLYQGKKIQAIKLAREKMGWGLAEAKQKIESVQEKMRKQFPDAFPEKQASGCGTTIFVFAIFFLIFSYVLGCP